MRIRTCAELEAVDVLVAAEGFLSPVSRSVVRLVGLERQGLAFAMEELGLVVLRHLVADARVFLVVFLEDLEKDGAKCCFRRDDGYTVLQGTPRRSHRCLQTSSIPPSR